jgi:hypothetical protein
MMAIMGSSNPKPDAAHQLYCRIRKEWVAALPEERVRQSLLNQLIDQLNFPASGICLERGLNQMPHLSQGQFKMPKRRADIVCFAQGIHPKHALYPLLLIECKAVPLSARVVNQVVSYNHFVGAYFVCIANSVETRLGWYDTNAKAYRFKEGLLPFEQLKTLIGG